MRIVKKIYVGENTALTFVSEKQGVYHTFEIMVSGRGEFNSAINIADVNSDDLITISNALLQIAAQMKIEK